MINSSESKVNADGQEYDEIIDTTLLEFRIKELEYELKRSKSDYKNLIEVNKCLVDQLEFYNNLMLRKLDMLTEGHIVREWLIFIIFCICIYLVFK